ncbi:MAG: hypothetical protein CVU78_07000 [Elusimicrobia bacterium HGW-Elusimicrobia-2]|nr:MAG: hypothetical protein CVU78_07000 [Elusimicrobia bacterium HGW-Elusimicrobia-2]
MIYLLAALTISFFGYKTLPRQPAPQVIAIPTDKIVKNIPEETEKADNPPSVSAASQSNDPANLIEYIGQNVKEGPAEILKKENITPEHEPGIISLSPPATGKFQEQENTDWVTAKIRTSILMGLEEPGKTIITLFNSNEEKKLEQLLQNNTSIEKTDKHYILGELNFKNKDYATALGHYTSALSTVSGDGFYDCVSFRKAEVLYNTGKFDEAMEIFEKISPKKGGLIPEAEFSKAQCHLKKGETKTALDIMNRLLSKYEQYQTSDRANYCIGLILYYQSRYSEAETCFARIKSPDFENLELSEFYRAKCIEAEGALLQAGAIYKKIYAGNVKTGLEDDAMFAQGIVYYKMKEYDSAAGIFLNILSKYPAGDYAPYARLMTGYCRYESGRYTAAIANCKYFMEKYTGTEPEAYTHHLWAKSCAEIKKYDSAYEKYREIIAAYPGQNISLTASCDLALLYYNTGQYENALSVCEKILEGPRIKSSDTEKNILLMKGMCLYREGNRNASATVFQGIINSINDAETRGKALFMLAMQYVNSGDNDTLMTSILSLADKEDLFTAKWKSWTYYIIADAYYNSGKINEAEKTFEYIIATYPGTPAVKFAESGNIACKVLRGEYAAAELKNREFSEKFKDDKSVAKAALLSSAGLFFNAGNYRKAIADYKDFLKNYSGGDAVYEALFLQGECFFKLQHIDEAQKCWKRIIHKNSEYTLEAYNRLAYTSFGLGNYTDAVFYYRKIKQRFPSSESSKNAQMRIAQSYYNSGKFTQAIADFKKFIALYPGDEKEKDVLENIRMAYYEKGLRDAGGQGLAEFVKLYPDGDMAGEAYWQLGTRAFEKKQYVKASALFRKIIIEYPQTQSSELALYYLAESLYMAENNKDAINAFNNFITSFPENSRRYSAGFHMANALFKLGRIEESCLYYSALADDPKAEGFAPDAALNKALCYKRMKKWDEAIAGYEDFIKKYPSHEKKGYAMFQAAEINRNNGNYKEAARSYADSEKYGSAESETLYRAAECYLKSGDIENAERYYIKLQNLKSPDKTFYLTGLVDLAEIYVKADLYDKAIPVYKKIMETSDNEEWIAAAEAKINEINEKKQLQAIGSTGAPK